MAPYNQYNTEQRIKAATDCFEKVYLKLMNNGVSGKTMEDVQKRKDVVLVRLVEGDKIRFWMLIQV